MPHGSRRQTRKVLDIFHFFCVLENCSGPNEIGKMLFFLSAEKRLFFLFLAFATAMVRIKAQQREKVIDALKPKMC